MQRLKDEVAHVRRAYAAYLYFRSYKAGWKTYKQSRISQYGRNNAREWAEHLERGYNQLAAARPNVYCKLADANSFPDNQYYRVDPDGYLKEVIEND